MDQPHRIVAELIKIAEHADAFRHGSEDFYGPLNLTEVHCIHWIGILDHANVTKVSNEMGMTRGAISKICKKLLQKQLIEKLSGAGKQQKYGSSGFSVGNPCQELAG